MDMEIEGGQRSRSDEGRGDGREWGRREGQGGGEGTPDEPSCQAESGLAGETGWTGWPCRSRHPPTARAGLASCIFPAWTGSAEGDSRRVLRSNGRL